MKIGRTDFSANTRISDSVGISPEKPKIGFLLKVRDSKKWESIIHSLLHLAARHHEHGVGNEWFNTSPNELESIVNKIKDMVEGLK